MTTLKQTLVLILLSISLLSAAAPTTTPKPTAKPQLPVLPLGAVTYMPLLNQQLDTYWPLMPWRAGMAGQIERETCVSLKSKVCWTPNAQLKTSSEYGFGYGQTTIAYNKDGSERFNSFTDIRRAHSKELSNWTWENRLDPTLSMRAYVLPMHKNFQVFEKASPYPLDVLRFTFASHNGGMAGTLKEIRMCTATPNCNPFRWKSAEGRAGVETTSNKSRTAKPGYGGQSAFATNRSYVTDIMEVRSIKYGPHFEPFQQPKKAVHKCDKL